MIRRIPTIAARRPVITAQSLACSIAIDGPTASGKTVVGREVAERLGIGFLDTGMIYRACTLAVLRAGADPEQPAVVIPIVMGIDLDMRWPAPATPRVYLAGEDVTPFLREPDVEQQVSLVSRIPEVRDELVRRQRAIASRQPVVMAGRDIGTRVLVEAETKLFLEASAEIRAQRRLADEIRAGRESSFEEVLAATLRRDTLDNSGARALHREQAASDAIVIETDAREVDQVVAACVSAYGCQGGR